TTAESPQLTFENSQHSMHKTLTQQLLRSYPLPEGHLHTCLKKRDGRKTTRLCLSARQVAESCEIVPRRLCAFVPLCLCAFVFYTHRCYLSQVCKYLPEGEGHYLRGMNECSLAGASCKASRNWRPV